MTWRCWQRRAIILDPNRFFVLTSTSLLLETLFFSNLFPFSFKKNSTLLKTPSSSPFEGNSTLLPFYILYSLFHLLYYFLSLLLLLFFQENCTSTSTVFFSYSTVPFVLSCAFGTLLCLSYSAVSFRTLLCLSYSTVPFILYSPFHTPLSLSYSTPTPIVRRKRKRGGAARHEWNPWWWCSNINYTRIVAKRERAAHRNEICERM